MKEDNFRNLDKMSGELQKQFQAFMELNTKTLQNLQFLKPNGLSGLQNPGELMSKHVAFMMENNQRFFEYAHTSFRLMEAIFAPLAQVAKENTDQSIRKAASITREIQKPLRSAVSKKAVSRTKPSTAKNKATKVVAKIAKSAATASKSVAKRASSKAAPKLKVASKAKSKKIVSKPSTSATKMKASARKTTTPAIKKSASKAKTSSTAQKKTHTGSLTQASQKARSSLFSPVNGNKLSGLSERQIGHTFPGNSDKPKHPFQK